MNHMVLDNIQTKLEMYIERAVKVHVQRKFLFQDIFRNNKKVILNNIECLATA